MQALKNVLRNKNVTKSLLAYTVGGFVRKGAILRTLIPLLIFLKLHNEFHFGGWLWLSLLKLGCSRQYLLKAMPTTNKYINAKSYNLITTYL